MLILWNGCPDRGVETVGRQARSSSARLDRPPLDHRLRAIPGFAVTVRAQDPSAFIKRIYTDRDFAFIHNGASNCSIRQPARSTNRTCRQAKQGFASVSAGARRSRTPHLFTWTCFQSMTVSRANKRTGYGRRRSVTCCS